LFSEAVEEALKYVIADLDYDLHKDLEYDNGYPDLAEKFIKSHWDWAKGLELI
jgi:hypothetical protein